MTNHQLSVANRDAFPAPNGREFNLPEPDSADGEERHKPLRLLIVEDLETDADLMKRELRDAGIDFTALRVDTRDDFIRELDEFAPDMILADYSLPSFDGMSALLIAGSRRPGLPFIFVSGAMGEERAIELLKEGATDYILKERLSKLPTAVQRAMREMQERARRLRMERRLRDSEEKYRSLVESTDDSIYMLDRDGTYLFANQRYLSRIGHAAEKVIGRRYSDFHGPEQVRGLETRVGQVFESGNSTQYEDSGPDAGHYYLRTLSPVKNPETGQTVAITVISKDITERKAAEDVLRKAHDELELRVRDRTAELAASNELLKQEVEDRKIAENALIKANEELSRTIAELEVRNREIEILSEMGSLLQACVSAEEAHKVIALSLQNLFSTESGSMYLLDPHKNLLESMAVWGEKAETVQLFESKDCWALRLGRPYFVDGPQAELVCAHMQNTEFSAYFDVPMIAQGETFGLLTLRFNSQWAAYSGEVRDRLSKHKQQLAVAVAEDIALSLANFRLRETLYVQSMHDALTGLFNRRYLEDLLNRELHRMSRRGSNLGIMMLDIDFFKQINDSFGHEAGDVYLRELGGFLKNRIRTEDFACRYGGEEFVIVLPETPPDIVLQRAEFLRREVEKMDVQFYGKSIGRKTVSIGVADSPAHGSTVDQILKASDAALYKAKMQGRNRVVVFEGDKS